MVVHSVQDVQLEKDWYQSAHLDERNLIAPPILHGYQTQASILQSNESGSLSNTGVRRNDSSNSEPN